MRWPTRFSPLLGFRFPNALALAVLAGAVGCSSTRLALGPPKVLPGIKTTTSIGDRPVSVVAGVTGDSHRRSVEVADRSDRAGGRISGQVVDDHGQPVPEAEIRLADGSRPFGRDVRVRTDAAGRFTLRDLRPGTRYTLIADDGHGPSSRFGRAVAQAPEGEVLIRLGRDEQLADLEPEPDPAPDSPRIDRVSERREVSDFDSDSPMARLNPDDIPPAPVPEASALASRSPGRGILAPGSVPTRRQGWRSAGSDGLEPLNSEDVAETSREPDGLPERQSILGLPIETDDGPNPLPPAIEQAPPDQSGTFDGGSASPAESGFFDGGSVAPAGATAAPIDTEAPGGLTFPTDRNRSNHLVEPSEEPPAPPPVRPLPPPAAPIPPEPAAKPTNPASVPGFAEPSAPLTTPQPPAPTDFPEPAAIEDTAPPQPPGSMIPAAASELPASTPPAELVPVPDPEPSPALDPPPAAEPGSESTPGLEPDPADIPAPPGLSEPADAPEPTPATEPPTPVTEPVPPAIEAPEPPAAEEPPTTVDAGQETTSDQADADQETTSDQVEEFVAGPTPAPAEPAPEPAEAPPLEDPGAVETPEADSAQPTGSFESPTSAPGREPLPNLVADVAKPQRPTWRELTSQSALRRASLHPPSMRRGAGEALAKGSEDGHDRKNRFGLALFGGKRDTTTEAAKANSAVTPTCEFDERRNRLVDFTLPDLQGRPVHFRDIDADYILLDFWGTWCGPCVKSVPHLVRLQNQYDSSRLRVVGVAYEQAEPSEGVALVERAVRDLGVNYPILLGEQDRQPCPLATALKIQAYPTLILLDRHGRILWRDTGGTPQTLTRLDRVIAANTRARDGVVRR